MANRLRGYEISRPRPFTLPAPDQQQQHHQPQSHPQPHDQPTATTKPAEIPTWPPPASRPLSDIREITEPSLIDLALHLSHEQPHHRREPSRQRSLKRDASVRREGSSRRAEFTRRTQAVDYTARQACELPSSSSYSSTPDAGSRSGRFAIPPSSVPRRSSSFGHVPPPTKGHARKASIREPPLPPHRPEDGQFVPNRGPSRSPVKAAGLRHDPVTSDATRRAPSRTVVRSSHQCDVLDFPSFKHPRVKLELQVNAPLFVGGGTIEGNIRVVVDDLTSTKQRRSLGIVALSVDVIGFEEVGNRRATFLGLGTELIDKKHPPPSSMVEPTNPLAPFDKFWTLSPSASALPFMISLPLDTGPAPFQSKQASVRFLLSATALVRDASKHYRVRTTKEVQILPTYDPETALASLRCPLTTSDELTLARAGGYENVRVTAGLHRQVWVSGSSIFVDVHVANRCHKTAKHIDLSLERNILCYKHAAATTKERQTSQARISESNTQLMVARSTLKASSNAWQGVGPYSSETRTCELEIPRGHATIRPGKYLEVRYFLNITVSVSNTKLVSLQLPITLIHMNSLDVVPNSVAQVAAAIEEKRIRHHQRKSSETKGSTRAAALRQRSVSSPARTNDLHRKPSYTAGRAFAAPRQQSLDRLHAEKADIDHLRNILDSSPRKHHRQPMQGVALRATASNMSFGNVSISGKSTGTESAFRAMAYQTPPKRPPHEPESVAAERVGSIRDRMRRMQSLESLQSRKSTPPRNPSRFGPWQENIKPAVSRIASRPELAPHALGLGRAPVYTVAGPGMSDSFRERQDQRRFEFKTVRRKASVASKKAGGNWWEHMRRKSRDREDWI